MSHKAGPPDLIVKNHQGIELARMTEEHSSAWGQFVLAHDEGNIFQTPEMAEVYQRHEALQPVTLLALEKGSGAVCGGLVGLLLVEKPGVLSALSTRAIIQGGPLFRPDRVGRQAVPLLMEAFDECAGSKALFGEIWNLFAVAAGGDVFTGTGYEWLDHLNFLIDLRRSPDDIFASFSKSRRKNLRRSEQAGVTVSEITSADDLDIFYELLRETYDRVRLPLVSPAFFNIAFEILVSKQMAHFFLARHGGEAIGARAVLTYKNLVYDWFAGSPGEAQELYPDETLVWHILQWAVANGYTCFNFGGAGKPGQEYGPREFKRRFGGELVNLGRYRKIYSPVKLKLAEFGLRAYQMLPAR
jgi:serine/alanine adding enzyme